MDVAITAAIVSVLVAAAIGGIIAALRYVFDVQLATNEEVDKKIEQADENLRGEYENIYDRLEQNTEQLERIEELIMGGEYQVSDGMLEIVEMNREDMEEHDKRIEGVERIQLKIRRRQEEHNGGEPVAHGEDLDPPPSMGTDDE